MRLHLQPEWDNAETILGEYLIPTIFVREQTMGELMPFRMTEITGAAHGEAEPLMTGPVQTRDATHDRDPDVLSIDQIRAAVQADLEVEASILEAKADEISREADELEAIIQDYEAAGRRAKIARATRTLA